MYRFKRNFSVFTFVILILYAHFTQYRLHLNDCEKLNTKEIRRGRIIVESMATAIKRTYIKHTQNRSLSN